MIEDKAAQASMAHRRLTRASQVLTGIVRGILADGHLHDMEVHMLRTWLTENADVAAVWPGSAVAALIHEVLTDGVIDAAERAHLTETLVQLCNTDFAQSGSVSAEVAALPFDDEAEVDFREQGVCHTGQFIYGTRKSCEALTAKAGGLPLASVSGRVAYLVVGSHVSPNWITESYGLKIAQAQELKRHGRSIAILSERRWLQVLGAA